MGSSSPRRGGAATTSTTRAEPSRGCRWRNRRTGDLTTHGFRASVPASLLRRLGAALRRQCGGDDRWVCVDVGDARNAQGPLPRGVYWLYEPRTPRHRRLATSCQPFGGIGPKLTPPNSQRNCPMITISAFKWVPDFAQGQVRDLRARWALEEIADFKAAA
jgi:hypothetical protein